jgi:hypothetical protein
MVEQLFYHLFKVGGKKLFLGAGCGVWGFSGGQLPNFQGKSA